jgi:hypothetical protein
MLIALAILTTTSKSLAACQCLPGMSEGDAREIVESLAMKAEGHLKGSLNLRFMFDSNATAEDLRMWQSLVIEKFFAAHAVRIHIQLSEDKKEHYWVDATDVAALNTVIRETAEKGIHIAIYNLPTLGDYRLTAV